MRNEQRTFIATNAAGVETELRIWSGTVESGVKEAVRVYALHQREALIVAKGQGSDPSWIAECKAVNELRSVRLKVPASTPTHADVCGALCPEHGDPRDTNITPKEGN